MTTPERLRRRQRREGWALIFLGLMVAGSSYVDHQRDNRQDAAFQKCITDQVTALTSSLTVRGDLNQQDTDATNRVILNTADAFRTQDFTGVGVALTQFETDQQRIKELRQQTKVPPFPNGKCD